MTSYGVPVEHTASPPFNAPAARRLREALGMAPVHVAYGLGAQYGLSIAPDTVVAWEYGYIPPTAREITALAGVLWCSYEELLAEPTTLREHRVARRLEPAELARRVDMDTAAYLRLEESPGGRWRATDRQTAALASALSLGPRALTTVTGRDEELTALLRSAVAGRWQSYVKPAVKLLPPASDRARLEAVLQRLRTEHQAGADPEEVLGRFWELWG
ncbi:MULTISPECIES: helix-turn-helix domain-containing protein [unclassified Streptomyces]|uniref:helix-turn-helix domain-containing protein n=1 Tax=unclassified Streptomyces TaxID=2593676 RepID=UPI0037F7EC2D